MSSPESVDSAGFAGVSLDGPIGADSGNPPLSRNLRTSVVITQYNRKGSACSAVGNYTQTVVESCAIPPGRTCHSPSLIGTEFALI